MSLNKPKIAIVGLGDTGGRIAGRIAEYGDVYIVNYDDWFKDYFKGYLFFKPERLDELIKVLLNYEQTMIVVGLGEDIVDSINSFLNNLEKLTVFAVKPFRAEKKKVKRAEKQLKLIGECVTWDLNVLLETMPNAPIGTAIDAFDDEITKEIKKYVKLG
ncbi:hypothetical protein DRP05_05900 [Archaeoglobales archaeon]|nr:MAG: hypothetical protein DRP05_05900 [Archaeoglobales archaeon]